MNGDGTPKRGRRRLSSEAEDQVEGGLLLDVVISQGASIFKLFSGEDESLLIRGNSFLVLDLLFDVVDGVRALDLKSDRLSGQGLDEDLHASSQTEHQVEGGLLLDVVISQGAAIFELFSGEDESLLIRGDSFLVLDLLFDVVNGVRALDFEGDGLSGQGLDEDLHSSSQTEHQVEGGLLLDVVISEGASILKLFSGEDESLLVGGNSFLVLDLLLDIVNGVRALDFQSDGLSGESLDEDLHASSQTEHQVEGRLLLDVVISKGASIFKLFSGEDESLLVGRNALLVLDFLFDVVDGVGAFNLEGDGLSGECLHEDLHSSTKAEDEVKG